MKVQKTPQKIDNIVTGHFAVETVTSSTEKCIAITIFDENARFKNEDKLVKAMAFI